MKTCIACSNKVTSKVSTVKYCSVSCARKHAPRRRNGPAAKERLEKKCPLCEKGFITRWARQVCCSKVCARTLNAKINGPGNWKGGVNKHPSGYLKALAKGHPAADANGYVMQHRLVMEQMLGRKLDVKERVHHKNGIRSDNRPENLELWNVDHKDPPGVRTIDQVRHLLARLTVEERHTIRSELMAHKDPAGVRTIDQVLDLAAKLPPTDRAELVRLLETQ